MAKLLVKTEGFGNRVIDLKLGLNRFGRSAANDFQIEHPTVSAMHCEILLKDNNEVFIKDCGSTNGTFLAGRPVQEARLTAGEVLAIGDVELLVESTEVHIAIPTWELPVAPPPVVLSDGGIICQRHPKARVTHRCTHCRKVMCDACVKQLRRRGGKTLKLCPVCSHPVERIGGETKKKKSILAFLQKTVKLPFHRRVQDPQE